MRTRMRVFHACHAALHMLFHGQTVCSILSSSILTSVFVSSFLLLSLFLHHIFINTIHHIIPVIITCMLSHSSCSMPACFYHAPSFCLLHLHLLFFSFSFSLPLFFFSFLLFSLIFLSFFFVRLWFWQDGLGQTGTTRRTWLFSYSVCMGLLTTAASHLLHSQLFSSFLLGKQP